jgi:ribulose-phosphate 3-epimerase
VHLDVIDGNFVGKPSWPFVGDRGEFLAIKKQERGFPFWEEMDFEVHLITADPLSLVREWVDAGATKIIMHIETLDYENDILALEQLKAEGVVELGFAINADTEIDRLAPFFEVADFVQVMTISKIGAQGAAFDERGLEHIKWIRQNNPHVPIAVDGSMNPETIPLAVDLGAERIVVGSYIFANSNPRAALEELQNLL